MIDKLTDRKVDSIYVTAIWLYLFLLIFEGALRKWLVPALASPLLVVRDPIVIWLVFVGFRKGWLKNVYVVSMMIVSTIALLSTLVFAHQNLITALFGWRIFCLYFPFIFVIGNILNRVDVLKIGKFILLISIPMTILIVIQFYSAQNAWVNRGVGGDSDGAGFSGAMGFFRPPGTFSFTSVYAYFQLLVSCFLFYFLLNNRFLHKSVKLKSWIIYLSLAFFMASIPFSISRTIFFQTIVILLFSIFAIVKMHQVTFRLFIMIGFIVVISFVLLSSGFLGDSLEAFSSRFESASDSEGGLGGTLGDRYLGSIVRALDNDVPFWGYGLGFGTNVGAQLLGNANLYTKFDSDQEWVRVFGECGILLGLLIMLIRTLFSVSFFFRSYKRLRFEFDCLPWIFSASILMTVMMGQFNASSNLGFAIFFGGLGVASLKSI